MQFRIEPAYEAAEEIGSLFAEYTDMLLTGDPTFAAYLRLQNYEAELQHPEEKYAPPGGRLYLAYCGEKVAGCIGLLRMDGENCEMKRLYVRPEYRGCGLGGMLVKRILEDAREIGYRHIYLDTLPFLTNAIAMYRKYGFYEIPRYNDSPMAEAVYLKFDL